MEIGALNIITDADAQSLDSTNNNERKKVNFVDLHVDGNKEKNLALLTLDDDLNGNGRTSNHNQNVNTTATYGETISVPFVYEQPLPVNDLERKLELSELALGSSILDEEFDITLHEALKINNNDKIFNSVSVTHHIDDNIHYSLISKDGKVLNSPASQHLISQFEKFVVQETILKTKTSTNSKTSRQSSILQLNENADKLRNDSNESVENKIADAEDFEQVGNTLQKPCRYASAGCVATFDLGSDDELHYETCNYRPLKCLMAPACNETLEYHHYISHLSTHFLVPVASSEVTTTVILTPHDFLSDQTWTPKWFTYHEQNFFAMLVRKNTGDWLSWVWMFGPEEDAEKFSAKIIFFKDAKDISDIFPVNSLRVSQETIELQRKCLIVSDETIHELTKVDGSIFRDFNLKVQIGLKQQLKAEQIIHVEDLLCPSSEEVSSSNIASSVPHSSVSSIENI